MTRDRLVRTDGGRTDYTALTREEKVDRLRSELLDGADDPAAVRAHHVQLFLGGQPSLPHAYELLAQARSGGSR